MLRLGYSVTELSAHTIILERRFMKLTKNTLVAVADGEVLRLFRNTGDDHAPKLEALPEADVSKDSKGSSKGHGSSSANPDANQQHEDGFAAGIAELLNQRALSGKIGDLIIIAAPRTLGELRKHYHKALTAILVGEIAKDLTGHSIADIEKAVIGG